MRFIFTFQLFAYFFNIALDRHCFANSDAYPAFYLAFCCPSVIPEHKVYLLSILLKSARQRRLFNFS